MQHSRTYNSYQCINILVRWFRGHASTFTEQQRSGGSIRLSVKSWVRTLTTPKVKTRNVIVPKEKVMKAEPRQQKVKNMDLEPRSLEPIKPKPPLPNQRVGDE